MNIWKRLLIVVTAPLAMAFLLALVSAPPAQTQAIRPATPVEVTNTPLPVTGNFGISGTPNVNVANSPTVKVGNGPGEAIPVTDVDGAVEPFLANTGASLPGDSHFSEEVIVLEVPADKRAVIEHVSCGTTLWTGESASTDVFIRVGPFGQLTGWYPIPQTNAGNSSQDGTNLPLFLANQPLKAYVPPGATVRARFRRLGALSGATGSCGITLSGYFVKAP